MVPLIFCFHILDVTSVNMAYGACLEPAIAQFNLSENLVNRPSVDPSRPLPFWDKFRLLLHGRWTMSVQRMRWLYPASLDPYNTTEVMDWTWSNLILDWTNGETLLLVITVHGCLAVFFLKFALAVIVLLMWCVLLFCSQVGVLWRLGHLCEDCVKV